MITLTTPPAVVNVLGSAATIAYDKLVATVVNVDVANRTITGTLTLTPSANAQQTPVRGTYKIFVAVPSMEVEVAQLDIFRKVTLTGPQQAAAQTVIDDLQTDVENALISLGFAAGTRSSGT